MADALSTKDEIVDITTTHFDIQDAIIDGVQQDLVANKLMELAS